MDVRFRSRRLERQATSANAAIRVYGPIVGRRDVQRVQVLRNVSGFAVLRQVKALRLHPLQGDRLGQFALNLTGFARLIITYDEHSDSVWIEEVTKHYGS